MALVLSGGVSAITTPTPVLGQDLVNFEPGIGKRGPFITSKTMEYASQLVVDAAPPGVTIGGSRSPDFPPTPAAPEPWVMGCIQNVIRQSIKVVWLNGLNEITANYNQSAPMLDAFLDVPGRPQHLPFYAEVSASGDTASMGFLYGLPGTPVGVPVLRPSGSGPAWNLAGATRAVHARH